MADISKILLVDDDVTSIAVLRRALADLGQLRFATSGADALRLARESVPDLVLLDVEMPGMSGFEVCTAMKSDPLLHDVPIIFITSHDGIEQEVTGLTLGGADFIGKPLRPALVIARARTQLTMKSMADALRRAAATDTVTGVANRRKFEDTLAFEWSRVVRSRSPLSLLMVDVDYFKAYNDRYGHRAGDDCLKSVAEAMGLAVRRATDLLARYGGEEFAVLLPETPQRGAWRVAQQLLREIDDLGLPHPSSSVAGHVTVSVGAATFERAKPGVPIDERANGSFGTATDLVIAADQALYASKHAGRHRACLVQIGAYADQPPIELTARELDAAVAPPDLPGSSSPGYGSLRQADHG